MATTIRIHEAQTVTVPNAAERVFRTVAGNYALTSVDGRTIAGFRTKRLALRAAAVHAGAARRIARQRRDAYRADAAAALARDIAANTGRASDRAAAAWGVRTAVA